MIKLIAGFGILIAALGILVATDFAKPQNQNTAPTKSSPMKTPAVSVLASNLEIPWALAFGPDGRMLITERPGRVKIIDTNGNVEPIASVDVRAVGEGGLHGIALDPDFSEAM